MTLYWRPPFSVRGLGEKIKNWIMCPCCKKESEAVILPVLDLNEEREGDINDNDIHIGIDDVPRS